MYKSLMIFVCVAQKIDAFAILQNKNPIKYLTINTSLKMRLCNMQMSAGLISFEKVTGLMVIMTEE